jgi:hypothetical protein
VTLNFDGNANVDKIEALLAKVEAMESPPPAARCEDLRPDTIPGSSLAGEPVNRTLSLAACFQHDHGRTTARHRCQGRLMRLSPTPRLRNISPGAAGLQLTRLARWSAWRGRHAVQSRVAGVDEQLFLRNRHCRGRY